MGQIARYRGLFVSRMEVPLNQRMKPQTPEISLYDKVTAILSSNDAQAKKAFILETDLIYERLDLHPLGETRGQRRSYSGDGLCWRATRSRNSRCGTSSRTMRMAELRAPQRSVFICVYLWLIIELV